MAARAASLGPYKLADELPRAILGPGVVARRWRALHTRNLRPQLVYCIESTLSRPRQRRILEMTNHLISKSSSSGHLLLPECITLCEQRGVCIITSYPGDHDGIQTLNLSCSSRNHRQSARLSLNEVWQVAHHLLSGLAEAHDAGLSDGPHLSLDRLFIDSRGRIIIELPGIWNAITGRSIDESTKREEITQCAWLIMQLAHVASRPLPSTTPAPRPRRSQIPPQRLSFDDPYTSLAQWAQGASLTSDARFALASLPPLPPFDQEPISIPHVVGGVVEEVFRGVVKVIANKVVDGVFSGVRRLFPHS